MQRTDEFQTEDLIDLGAASVETRSIPDPDPNEDEGFVQLIALSE